MRKDYHARKVLWIALVATMAFTFAGCKNVAVEATMEEGQEADITQEIDRIEHELNGEGEQGKEEDLASDNLLTNVMSSEELKVKYESKFTDLEIAEAIKKFGMKNPLYTQRLGADPYVISYEGRVYVYMTGDVVMKDANGNVVDNNYSKINTLNVFSSDDLVNWTDHGAICAAGKDGRATWGNNSWAPAVAAKEVDGQMKFFIYFANGGNGIGVLTSDSPTGPFTDPIKKALISRSTPNCANVLWLFDPAVLVDDDGRAYIYFGGGVPGGKEANPGTGRVAELGDDMISLKSDPIALDIPYLFEDSGINKIGDTYYYSYCSNWNVSAEDAKTLGFTSANIVYMTSDNPMGPFTLQGSVAKNPGNFFGVYGNNHHCIFEFNGEYYIAYHTQILEKKLGISGGYRCTHIDKVKVTEDGKIKPVTYTELGVDQVKLFDPYVQTEATTMGTMAGISTTQLGQESVYFGTGNMTVTDIHSGDWIALYGVDFGDEGAETFTANIKPMKEGEAGVIQIRLDHFNGDVVGYLEVTPEDTEDYKEMTTKLLTKVTGEHNLIFTFYGEGYEMDYWQFHK